MAVLDRFYCSLFLLVYCIFLLQHENIYRGLVRTLLHPLGTPDHTTGLRPGDLLDHLREVCFHSIDCYGFSMHEYLLNHLLLKPRDRLQDMQPNTIECDQKHCSHWLSLARLMVFKLLLCLSSPNFILPVLLFSF